MSLQDKTDFELNVLVAMHELPSLSELGGDAIFTGDRGEAVFVYPSKTMFSFEGDPLDEQVTANFVGDWGQMGPIIEREGITLLPHMAEDDWKASVFVSQEDIFKKYANVYNQSPLRAAAICFLMLKGAE